MNTTVSIVLAILVCAILAGRVTIAEMTGQLSTFNLTCTAFVSNGTPPSSLGTDMSLGTVEDALKILQK